MAADAALYQRNSSGNDPSIERQNAANEEAAAGFGWTTESYSDPVSASRFARAERPGWTQLCADIQAGAFRYVVLWESSRGDRKLATWAAFLDACREAGVGIYVTSHTRLYDLSRGRDWRALAEDGVDSGYESEKTSERTLAGIAFAATEGTPHGRIPYGYRREYQRVPGRVRPLPVQVPDEVEAPILRDIITRIASGDAISAIERDLGARGVITRTGGAWHGPAIRRVVTGGLVYIGKRRHNGGPLLDGTWPAIVEPDVYWKALAVLADRAAAVRRGDRGVRPGKARWLLSYLATCEVCGGPLSVQTAHRKVPVYRCHRSACVVAPVEWMDGEVAWAVSEYCSRPAFYLALTTADDAGAEGARAEAAAERARLEEVRRAMVAGTISVASFAAVSRGIEDRITSLEARASELSVPPSVRDLMSGALELPDREERVAHVRGTWDRMPMAARRTVIRNLFSFSLLPGKNLTKDRIVMKWAEEHRLG